MGGGAGRRGAPSSAWLRLVAHEGRWGGSAALRAQRRRLGPGRQQTQHETATHHDRPPAGARSGPASVSPAAPRLRESCTDAEPGARPGLHLVQRGHLHAPIPVASPGQQGLGSSASNALAARFFLLGSRLERTFHSAPPPRQTPPWREGRHPPTAEGRKEASFRFGCSSTQVSVQGQRRSPSASGGRNGRSIPPCTSPAPGPTAMAMKACLRGGGRNGCSVPRWSRAPDPVSCVRTGGIDPCRGPGGYREARGRGRQASAASVAARSPRWWCSSRRKSRAALMASGTLRACSGGVSFQR